MDSLSSKYDYAIFLGEFNLYTRDSPMKTFCDTYKSRTFAGEPACFKNPGNFTCIDLILTNKPLSFKNTNVIETGPSGFHKIWLSEHNIQRKFLKKVLDGFSTSSTELFD